MNVIADICIVPMGVGASVSKQVTWAHEILRDAGLNAQLHAYGTNVEGDYDDVMAAIKRCHQTLHERGVPRITTTIKLGSRIDKAQTIEDKKRVIREGIGGERS